MLPVNICSSKLIHLHGCMCTVTTVPSQVTDTYKVMSNLAQFITVFIANVTNQPELTPECTVIEPPCHSIACSSTDGSHYNFDISPCASPPTFHLEVHRSDGVNTFERTYIANNRVTMQYNKNTHFQVTMSYDVNLIILEVIDRSIDITTNLYDCSSIHCSLCYAAACAVP